MQPKWKPWFILADLIFSAFFAWLFIALMEHFTLGQPSPEIWWLWRAVTFVSVAAVIWIGVNE